MTNGVGTLSGIADVLNARAIKTRRERRRYAATVKTVLARGRWRESPQEAA